MTDTILLYLREHKFQQLKPLLNDMNPVDLAAAFEALEGEEAPLLFRLLPKDLAAETFVELDKDTKRYLIEKLKSAEELKSISITEPQSFAPHILNITLPGIKSETVLHYLSSLGIYVSSGSACSSNTAHTSSALTAYGRSAEEADSSIRISFSHRNEKEDVDALCEGLASALQKLARIKK